MNASKVSTNATALSAGWLQLRQEWRGNQRLRFGCGLIALTLAFWGLLLLQDQTDAWNVEADAASEELQRLQPLRSGPQWAVRAEEARKLHEAAQGMMWTAASQGLAEAALQDTLRSWADKAGLPVRELSVGAAPDTTAAQPVVLRARLVVDMERIGLMGLLAELGRSPRMMAVDVLRLRPVPSPGRAELEVRVLYRAEERRP